MEEIVFYSSEGVPDDKQGSLSLAVATTLHSQTQTLAFRQASCYNNGSAITGNKQGDRIFVAAKGKALINVYTWGKESPDQRIPVPEQLTCLTLCPNVTDPSSDEFLDFEDEQDKLPKFRLPYLLIGGGISGRLYVWELNSGLLLNVKEAHYQMPTVMKVTSDGSYLVTAGRDSRVIIWKISDLVQLHKDNEVVIKPVQVISDHTLEVTDLFLNNNIHTDTKLYTVSRDSTIRIYSLTTFQLLTTFVINGQIESLVVDQADRALYVGLQDGNIRQINLYEPNKATNVLEAQGGYGKTLTLQPDHELKQTITYHEGHAVTQLELSLDGSQLISGDSKGRVAVIDLVSKQVVRELKEVNGSITNLTIMNTFQSSEDQNIEKNSRAIPQFKRVITSGEPKEQDILFQTGEAEDAKLFDVDQYLERVSSEALFFENFTNVNSEVILRDSDDGKDQKIKELEDKVGKVTKAYTDIRAMYEELYAQHTKLQG
jgi:pre-rRNA-processing protein IPI3